MNLILENKYSHFRIRIVWSILFFAAVAFIWFLNISKAATQTVGGTHAFQSACNASTTWDWLASDDSSSYIDQAWMGSFQSWDDYGSTGEDFSGWFMWLVRGPTKPECGPPPNALCEASNCTGSSAASGTIFLRAGQPDVNLRFWVQGVNLVSNTPYGANVAYGYARIVCAAGQRNINGACVNISGTISVTQPSCTELCNQGVTWSSNALSFGIVYLIKDGIDTGLRLSGGPSGSGTFSGLGVGNYQVCLNGDDGFGTEVNMNPTACDSFTVGSFIPPPPPPPPTPTADLVVNGEADDDVTITPGGNGSYVWSSTNATAGSSTLSISPSSPDPCGNTNSSSWVITGTSGSISGATCASADGYTYTITYTVTGPGGSASDTVIIRLTSTPPPPPPANLQCTPTWQTVVIGQSANFNASGGTFYVWSAPGGSPSSGTGANFSTIYNTAGTKGVTLTDSGKTTGCGVIVEATPIGTIDLKVRRNPSQPWQDGYSDIAPLNGLDIRVAANFGSSAIRIYRFDCDTASLPSFSTLDDTQNKEVIIIEEDRCNYPNPGTYLAEARVYSHNDINGNGDYDGLTELGDLIADNEATITVIAGPNFELYILPSGRAVTQGQSTSFTVSSACFGGFNGLIDLSPFLFDSTTLQPASFGSSTLVSFSSSNDLSCGELVTVTVTTTAPPPGQSGGGSAIGSWTVFVGGIISGMSKTSLDSAINQTSFLTINRLKIADIKAKRSSDPPAALSDGPISITSGTAATINWTSTNATSCLVDERDLEAVEVNWNFFGAGLTGNQNTSPLLSAMMYRLTCTMIDSSTQIDIVEINIIPNFPPTASSVTATQPDYCVSGPAAAVNWTYSDPDGNPQSAFQVQVDDQGSAWNPPLTIDSGKVLGSGTSYFTGDGIPPWAWSTTYKARVRVWDSNDAVSNWSESASWATPRHAFPIVNFTWSPLQPAANQSVQFTDQTQSFDAGGVGQRAWNWLFKAPALAPSSTLQNPTYAYTPAGFYNINLTATDRDGYTCALTKPIGIEGPIPVWKEVSPR